MAQRIVVNVPRTVDIKSLHGDNIISLPGRDLARNEEFSEIAVINIFFTVLKTKTQLSVGGGGGVLRGKFRDKSRN